MLSQEARGKFIFRSAYPQPQRAYIQRPNQGRSRPRKVALAWQRRIPITRSQRTSRHLFKRNHAVDISSDSRRLESRMLMKMSMTQMTILSFQTETWKKPATSPMMASNRCVKLESLGNVPKDRSGHPYSLMNSWTDLILFTGLS